MGGLTKGPTGERRVGFEECDVGDFVQNTSAETESLVAEGTLHVYLGRAEHRYEAKFDLLLDQTEGCIWVRVE
jgi:hypothetical protein